MDDLIDCVQSDVEAGRLTKEVDIVLGNRGFKVKEWTISGDEVKTEEDKCLMLIK